MATIEEDSSAPISQDAHESETSTVAQTLTDINRNMGKMCQVLDGIWQQSQHSQDKRSPLQQSDVEEPRENGSRKRSRSGSPPMSDSSDEDENPDVRKSGKSRKTDRSTGRGKSEVEDDRMSVHVNDTPDNISDLYKMMPKSRIPVLLMKHSKVSVKSLRKSSLLVRM